ncbi:FKBP-type peptidyl-prolyl cis-trans isomerase [Flavobacterium sp. GN10]|uniref:peptidylprolyl isomerase n=1 Tax=Flavobacterium tagetis TaxID=2801336 RepID=A0ABS1KIQ2_9FLAO|nr:FKBP-type peptidyl-prolyl cis-trans isomerase [Flavobacterium tagetis]MBL0739138.1 FKBP-type peptidyl-prolyl cis-trans isomerase [Flavobacterium tagetis]
MNKFKYYFVLLLAGLAIVSCNKKDDDEVVVVPVRDYKEQYKADNDSIEKYLKNNYIKNVTADFDITFEKITDPATQVSIWDQQEYPLEHRDVYNRDVTYRVYYLTLRKGTGEAPCNFDSVSVSYTGNLLNGTQFDSSYGLAREFNLDIYANNIIEGWGEIMPKFNVGTQSAPGSDGTITYDNYGAGVMFLPSGLGFYANVQPDIPAYSPIMFSFKLFALKRADSEYNISNGTNIIVGDGVPTYKEDINGDGYVYDHRDKVRFPNMPASLIDDTDGDGIPDFYDFDDDGDGYTTRFEVTKPADAPVTGISLYYPYDPIPDNPATPNVDESETWGIPAFSATGNPDYTSPGRLRIHVDKDHHSAK